MADRSKVVKMKKAKLEKLRMRRKPSLELPMAAAPTAETCDEPGCKKKMKKVYVMAKKKAKKNKKVIKKLKVRNTKKFKEQKKILKRKVVTK